MIRGNIAKMSDLLKQTRGATPVSLIVETEPELVKPKTNPLAGRLRKRSYINGMIGWHYANSVNRQLAREEKDAEFEAVPRKWGQRLPNSPLVEHNGKLYLETKVEKVYDTKYILDDKEVTKEEIAEYLRGKTESSRQGTEKQIILRDYALDNIKEIRIKGKVHSF